MNTFVTEVGATLVLLGRAFARRCPMPALLAQVNDLLLKTVPLVVASMAFVGAVVIVDGGRQIQKLFGDPAGVGPQALELIVRVFGPTFGGVIAATRIGSGIAAELAAMKVSEQIDALELASADPVAELVTPRAWASLLALVVLGAVSTIAAAITGDFTAQIAFGSRAGAFLDTSAIDAGDLAVGFVKCVAYGLAIPALSARAGLLAAGGAPAVGAATTRGVVTSIVAVVFFDLVISAAALVAGV